MIRQAYILAGGAGTRLRPLTLEIPKPLVPVQQVPIATWLIRLFAKHGIEQVTVVYPTVWKQAFETWASQEFPIPVTLFEETEAMGTAGAMLHALHPSAPVIVTNGDELKGLDLTQLISFHESQRTLNADLSATIALVRVPNPSEYGVAEMDGDRITKFHEKPEVPPTTLISSGLYVIEPSIWSEFSSLSHFVMFEKQIFPQLADTRRLFGCALDGSWYDCGTMERWEKAIREWPGIV